MYIQPIIYLRTGPHFPLDFQVFGCHKVTGKVLIAVGRYVLSWALP